MAVTTEDLQALLAKVEEADAILARKDELAHEIAIAEKRLGKLQAEHSTVEHELETTRQKAIGAQDNYEHERARYSVDLRTFVEDCEQKKRTAAEGATREIAQLHADAHSFRARCAEERRGLESAIGQLQGNRDCLVAAIQDFKKQITALPE